MDADKQRVHSNNKQQSKIILEDSHKPIKKFRV